MMRARLPMIHSDARALLLITLLVSGGANARAQDGN